MPAHSGAADHAADDGERHVDAPRQVELEADPAGGRAGHQHLAAATDVEQAGPEREAHAEAGGDQRRGELEGLGQRPDRGRRSRRRRCCRPSPGTARCRRPRRVPDRREEVAGSREEVADAGRCTRSSVNAIMQRADEHREHHREHRDVALPVAISRSIACATRVGSALGGARRPRRRASGAPAPRRRVGSCRVGAAARAAAGRSCGGSFAGARRPSSGRAPRGGCRRGTMPTMRPRYMHHDPVGERDDLVELGRDDQHGHAAVAGGDDPLVDELDRADVDAAGRLGGDEQAQVAARARARRRPSAGCRPRACRPAVSMPGARTSYSLSFSRGELVERVELQGAVADERGSSKLRLSIRFSAMVMLPTRPSSWRSSGMKPTPASRILRTERPTSSLPSSVIEPVTWSWRPSSASVSSVWPLPCTPATASTSPRVMVKLTSSTCTLAEGVDDAEVLDDEGVVAELRLRPCARSARPGGRP